MPAEKARQPPNTCAFSTTSTRKPSSAADTAADNPPAPEPTTTTSASTLWMLWDTAFNSSGITPRFRLRRIRIECPLRNRETILYIGEHHLHARTDAHFGNELWRREAS